MSLTQPVQNWIWPIMRIPLRKSKPFQTDSLVINFAQLLFYKHTSILRYNNSFLLLWSLYDFTGFLVHWLTDNKHDKIANQTETPLKAQVM